MLYVFVGDDVVKVRSRVHAFLDEQELADVERVTVESYIPGMMADLAQAESLFGPASPVLLDFLSEDDAIADVLEEYIEALASSPRFFAFMDMKPKAALQKVLKKHAKTYEELLSSEGKERFNTFALADAFSRKDKKSLWVLLQRARIAGVGAEEVLGTLFWQLKALRLAQMTSTPAEAGMKEFPYKKAKSAAKTFSKEELGELSRKLLRVYHEGHGGRDIDVGLERFVLSV